jgi:hypothetical protein
MKPKISLDTRIEDLVLEFPETVRFLIRRGVRCIRCGEPLWCSLGELLEEEGIKNPGLLVSELNQYIDKRRERQ